MQKRLKTAGLHHHNKRQCEDDTVLQILRFNLEWHFFVDLTHSLLNILQGQGEIEANSNNNNFW